MLAREATISRKVKIDFLGDENVSIAKWQDSHAMILWSVVGVPPQLNFHLE